MDFLEIPREDIESIIKDVENGIDEREIITKHQKEDKRVYFFYITLIASIQLFQNLGYELIKRD